MIRAMSRLRRTLRHMVCFVVVWDAIQRLFPNAVNLTIKENENEMYVCFVGLGAIYHMATRLSMLCGVCREPLCCEA